MSPAPDSAVRDHVAAHATAFLADLTDWLRIPSVSAEPERAGDVRRSAQWLAERLRATGFPVAEVWETPGLPAVFAQWPSADPDAPTVLVYGHHDVQPADRADGWTHDPFDPTERDGRLYARGAADDKGQVWMHTLGLRAHLAATGRTAPAADLRDVLDAPVLFLGVSVPSDGWHAPNEKAELALLRKGAEAVAHLWDDLPRHWQPARTGPTGAA
ncbi:M20/M25/M40 family metallo-hydrolase [Streptomyces sp. JJ66]|nr:M20/M25/M40 family metallo-hydrolase [Streptomyces sp. JJ66]